MSTRSKALRALGCALASTVVLAAQTQFVTVPQDLDAREGNAVATFVHPFGYSQSRFQYTDGGQRGTARPGISKLELRRDGLAQGSFPSRTANLALVMAETDVGQLTTNFAANYSGAPTTVFLRKVINVPDLSAAPPTPPAPWTIAFPFDANWNYTGAKDLLWEIQVDANTGIGAPLALDAVQIVVPGEGSYSYDGLTSCTTASGSFTIYGIAPRTARDGTVTFATYAAQGPVSAPGVLALGLSDPNLVGVFCAPLRTSAEVLVPVATDATGSIGAPSAPLALGFPFPGPLTVFSQFAVADAVQSAVPIALSDAVRSEIVAWVPDFKVSRLSSTLSANAPSGVRSSYQVLVARLVY